MNLTIAKIAWLKQYRPDIFALTSKYLDVHSFLGSPADGVVPHRLGMRRSNRDVRYAKQWLGRNFIRTRWASGLTSSRKLPATGTILGTVLQSAAEACGLPVRLARGGGNWRWAGEWSGSQHHLSRRGIFISGNFDHFGNLQRSVYLQPGLPDHDQWNSGSVPARNSAAGRRLYAGLVHGKNGGPAWPGCCAAPGSSTTRPPANCHLAARA